MSIRRLSLANKNNGGDRTLMQSVMVPEVLLAIQAMMAVLEHQPLLIGGLAVSYWTRPRSTQDIDFLFMSESEIPSKTLSGFKKNRTHCYEHISTGVEVELLTPQFLGIPVDLVKKVRKEAHPESGLMIPSIHGIIALKSCRLSLQDRADIHSLWGIQKNPFNIEDWHLTDSCKSRLKQFLATSDFQ